MEKQEQKTLEVDTPRKLLQDLRQIVEQARTRVAAHANSELTMMYWHIGERINREIFGSQRAEYGKQIVATVLTQLQQIQKSLEIVKTHRGTYAEEIDS